MTYLDKVKTSKKLIEVINKLGSDESVKVTYGKDYNGKDQVYCIRCTIWESGERVYSINKDEVWGLNGMNVESITNTQLKCYTYDMMSQRTSYNFPLYEMVIVEDNPLEKLEGFIGTEKGI